VDVPNGDGAAFDRLVELGAIDADRLPDGRLAAVMPDSVTSEQIARALGLGARHVSVSPVNARDAGSVWVLGLRPVPIGRLRIVPAGMATDYGDVQLLDNEAFGTGLHPTTRLCLEALDDLIATTRPDSILDVGTGSGILALGALRLGVARASAIDIDPRALRVAGENARLNQLDGRIQLVEGGADAVDGTWPLVAANVLAAPLIEMAPALVRRVGRRGHLVLSGIPSGVADDVDQAYRRLGLRRSAATSRQGWTAFVLRPSW
jgi:ribosomal protein L11 methyltransferase